MFENYLLKLKGIIPNLILGFIGGAIMCFCSTFFLPMSAKNGDIISFLVGLGMLYLGCFLALPEDCTDTKKQICAIGALIGFIMLAFVI